jgi:hypothetical protein
MARQLLEVAPALLDLQDTIDRKSARGRALRCKAISACYYATFHATASLIADRFSPSEIDTKQIVRWQQVFRSLDHRQIVKVASQIQRTGQTKSTRQLNDPASLEPLEIWAENIVTLQEFRHRADYDPFYQPSPEETETILKLAEDTLNALENLSQSAKSQLAVDLAFPTRANK